jgi:hypothetical protein
MHDEVALAPGDEVDACDEPSATASTASARW